MSDPEENNLSKRERGIMDVLHRLGEGSVQDVIDHLSNPSGYNSIRMLMNILAKKGHLQHRTEKKKYVYFPTVKKEVAKKSALSHLMSVYFDKSVPDVVSTLLSEQELSEKDLEELNEMIDKAKEKIKNE